MATSFCIISLLGVGLACTEPAEKVVVDTFCQTAETIIASRNDTAETLRQVRRENAKRRKCPSKVLSKGQKGP